MVLNTEVISDTFNVATSVNHAEIVSLSNLLTCTACQPLQTEWKSWRKQAGTLSSSQNFLLLVSVPVLMR